MKLNKEVKVGIIAILIITVSIWGYSFLKGKNLLSTNDIYYAIYENIDGLEEASPVTISGFKIGLVESINIHDTYKDKIVVRFAIEEDIQLPKNSEAIIYPASLIAGKAIKINFSDSKEMHTSGDTIIGILEIDMVSSLSAELVPVKNKIENLVESLDSVLTIFDDERRGDLKESLNNINKITGNLNNLLDTENSKLATILNNVASISTNLNKNEEKITNILENFSNISDSLDQANIKGTILNANATLAEFSEISRKINNGEGTIGLLINNDSLYNNLNNLAADLDTFVIDLNKNPKRYVQFSLFGKSEKK